VNISKANRKVVISECSELLQMQRE